MTNKIDVTKIERAMLVCSATIEALAPDATGAKTVPKVSMNAYNGGAMFVGGFGGTPVVIDLQGMSIPLVTPIRLEHDRHQGVGHLDTFVNDGKSLRCSGYISRDTESARDVVASARNGFPWQASVGCSVKDFIFLADNGKAKINGQDFTGPLYIATKTVLHEVSLTELGADTTTSATIAAKAAQPEENMKINKDPAAPSTGTEPTASAQANPVIQASQTAPNIQTAEQIRAAAVIESTRIAEISAINCSAELKAKAIADGVNAKDFELTVLRANRPVAPNTIVIEKSTGDAQVLECALAQASKMPNLEKIYKPEHLEAAHREFKGGYSLQQLMIRCAQENGFKRATMRGNELDVQRAAFALNASANSNINIGGILSNIANKNLLAGYEFTEQTWRSIAAIAAVQDFKTTTSYRLTGNGTYAKVAPGGEIKNGTLGEESYTNQAETYGLMLTIDRTAIINDDLNALSTIPRKLGSGAGVAFNNAFYQELLDDASFFSSGNSNYLTGTPGSLLTVDGLTNLENLFNVLKDADGNLIGHTARILLVPTALSTAAAQLMNSMELRNTTASTNYGTANPHQGKFTVASSRYLQQTTIGGVDVEGSSTAWYLLAAPQDVAVIQAVFLNGQENPTVESAAADFNRLGIQMRGVHDFGIRKQDPRGGCKAKGAA